MSVSGLLLALPAFALGICSRRLFIYIPQLIDIKHKTNPIGVLEIDGQSDEFQSKQDTNSNESSRLTSALTNGKYVALGELHRFAELRGQIGFPMSDHLIAQFAAEIEKSLPNCTLGRVGRKSVEFVFAAKNPDNAQERLEKLSQKIESELEVDGCHIGLVSHFGAVRLTEHGGRAIDHILHQAEAALTTAVARRERSRVVDVLEPAHGSAHSGIAIRDFPRAIAKGEFELFYQPKLHCRTDNIRAVEALLRWEHPIHGRISTQELIEIAEATGAIRDLTKWVIDKAVADQKLLDRAGLDVSIDINFSGTLLANVEMTEWALLRLTSTTRPMGVEVTETAVIVEPELAIANLRRLSAAGVRIAIDDYGSGLSSLAYLKQLPAHELKIDREFVSGLTESHRDPLIIRSTIDLAHALEMEVTAEGVDDPMAFALLRAMGCDIIQGYLVAAPMPFDQLCNFVTGWQGSEHHRPQNSLIPLPRKSAN